MRSRKRYVSIVYISQSYFDEPKIKQLNCSYFTLFKGSNQSKIDRIKQNHASD